MKLTLVCPDCGAIWDFLYSDPKEELPCDCCGHFNPLYMWNPVKEEWTKRPPGKPGWYWTRTTDGWCSNTILPGEVKSSGDAYNPDTYTRWGDHEIEWYSMPFHLPDGYNSHK